MHCSQPTQLRVKQAKRKFSFSLIKGLQHCSPTSWLSNSRLQSFFAAATSWQHALACKQKEKHWPRTEHFQSRSSEDKWALPVSEAPALVHCSAVLFCSPFPGISFPFHFSSSVDYTPPQIIYYLAFHSPGPYWDQATVRLCVCVWGHWITLNERT